MSDIHSHAHPYVVGALSSDELAEFETHLRDCASCRAEVADLQDLTFQLSEAVAVDPPSALRSSVLTAIAHTTQLPPVASAATTSLPPQWTHADAGGRPSSPGAPSASSRMAASNDKAGRRAGNVVPLHRRSRERLLTSLLSAAAVLAAFAFGGIAWQSRQASRDAVAQSQQLAEVLSADDVRTVQGRFVQTDFTGSVVMSKQLGTAMFVADDLPPLPDGKVYEAWTIQGDPRPAGTFTPDSTEPAVLELPDTAFEADSVAITVEPDGGSERPTTDAVFSVVMPGT